MSFKTQFQQAIANAPTRSGFVNVNYGKLTCAINVLSWKGKGQAPVRTPYAEGTEIQAGQTLEIEFNVGVKELNPALEFENWTRRVNVENGLKGKTHTDWEETVMPSLIKVFGADEWYDVVLGKKKWYVAVEQADSVNPPAKDKKDYGFPKFLEKFKNLAECKAAREARYGKSEEATGEGNGMPENVKDQLRSLYASVGNDAESFGNMLDSLANVPPFNSYSKDELIAAVE